MVTYFQNRELSTRLGIKLCKWKRWSREFLPPDPLGGMQSGYARQYSLDDAFNVYMGGYLVAELKFSIPEARQVLSDLREWMLSHGFFTYHDQLNGKEATGDRVSETYHIRMSIPRNRQGEPGSIQYDIQCMVPCKTPGEAEEPAVCEQTVTRMEVNDWATHTDPFVETGHCFGARVVYLSELHRHFMACLG